MRGAVVIFITPPPPNADDEYECNVAPDGEYDGGEKLKPFGRTTARWWRKTAVGKWKTAEGGKRNAAGGDAGCRGAEDR